MVSFTKAVNQRLAKRPLVFNGRLANRWLTALVKETTGVQGHAQLGAGTSSDFVIDEIYHASSWLDQQRGHQTSTISDGPGDMLYSQVRLVDPGNRPSLCNPPHANSIEITKFL